MARIFVSHSSLDQAAAREIMSWLRSLGFDNAFLDIDERTGIRPGDPWEARLYEELSACSAVVLLVTPHWLASKWCFAEFVQARATGKAIFPIILTPDGGQGFAGDLQRVDFTTDPEAGRRSLAQRLTDLALDVQSGFDWDARRAPYPGLPSFEAEDAAVYFGRDPEVRELIDRLRARRAMGGAHMVAVLGASGSGKSSLVRAGVLPRLRKFEPGFVVVPPLRPGTDPCTELAKALAEALGQPTQWRTLRGHLEAEPGAVATDLLMAAGRREATLLITIDQAEELFGNTPVEARAQFAQWLRELQRLPVLLLLTIRSDHLGELQHWAQGVGAFEQFSLPPLPPARLAQVIEGPARVAGLGIAPGVVDAVMHDAGGADAMPLLAFTLRELWGRAMADAASDAAVIRLADYQSLGDAAAGLNPLENAVRRRADELASPLDEAARRVLREAFVGSLVRVDDQGVYGRRVAAWEELDPAAHATLNAFVDARLLVVRSDDAGRRSVEVAHEALLRKWPLLRDWLDDERGFLIGRLQLQRALDDWRAAEAGQRDSALLQGLMLERARAWAVDRPKSLSAEQREFVAASVARAQTLRTAQRRRRIGVALVGVLALSVITGLGVYLRQERLASSALAIEVEADRWLQRASAALAYGQSDRALAQAAQAHRLSPGAKTRSAVWQAGVSLPSQWRFSVPAVNAQGELPASSVGAVSALAFDAGGQGLLVGDRAGALHQLALQGERRAASVPADRMRPSSKDLPEAVLALQALADGARIAVLEDGRVLRQPPGADRYVVLAQGEPLAGAAITADGGGVLALTQGERQLRWLDCAAARCAAQPLFDASADTDAIALDPRSATVAAADAAGHLLIGRAGEAARRVVLALPEGVRVRALALDGPAGRIALATSAGELWVLDTDGRVQAKLPSFGAAGRQLAWAPGGEQLVADCESSSLCVWRRDGEVYTLAGVLAVRGAASGGLAWSPDGRLLAGGDVSGRIHLWDVGGAPSRATVLRSPQPAPLADVAAHPDGRRVAAADVRGRVWVWDVPSQRVLLRLAHPVATEARGLRFHPQLPQLALGTLGGGVEVFALDGGASLGSAEGSIEAVAWDAAQGRLITGGQDGVVRAMVLATGSSEALPEPHADAVVALAVAPASAGQASTVHSADTRGVVKSRGAGETGTVATATDAAGKPFSVDSLAFSPDGRRWLAAGAAGDVLVFDRATHKLLQRLETGADQVHAAAFSPDGAFVAAIDNAGRLQVWRGAELQRYATLWLRTEPGRTANDAFGVLGPLRRLAWLPDSLRVAVTTQSGVVLVLAVPVEDWLAPLSKSP